MRAFLHNIPALRSIAVLAVVFAGAVHTHAQDPPARKTPILLYGFLDASFIAADVEGGVKNGPRLGLVLTHNPTGWGIGFASQFMLFRGAGPTLRGDGWFGPWSHEPKDRVTFQSIMATKEFHTSSPLFRPGLEAGISFVNYRRRVLENNPTFPLLEQYVSKTERTIGLDVRAKILLALSTGFGVEVAVQSNFNDLRPYSSFAIGMVAGLVRARR